MPAKPNGTRTLFYPCRICGAHVFKPDPLDWRPGQPNVEYIRYLRCSECVRLDLGRQKLTGYRKADFEAKPGENRLTSRVTASDL